MSDRQRRANERSSWSVRIVRGRVGEHESAASDGTTAEQRLGMMWELVEQAWALAGRTIPDYQRHEMPVQILRGGVTE